MLRERLSAVHKERDQLQRIVEVLDAPEDDATESICVPSQESEEPSGSPRVAEDTREGTLLYGREAGTSEEK
jgi:hypothetical protein